MYLDMVTECLFLSFSSASEGTVDRTQINGWEDILLQHGD